MFRGKSGDTVYEQSNCRQRVPELGDQRFPRICPHFSSGMDWFPVRQGLVHFQWTFYLRNTVSRFGNRLPLALYFFTGGLCALIAGVLPGTTNAGVISQNIMAFASRLCFVGTVCIIFVYTSELCPTVIRNNIFNLCSVALRLGSMSAPLLPLMVCSQYSP